MWLKSYSHNEMGQLVLLLCHNKEENHIDGKIVIAKDLIKITSKKGKNAVLRNQLKMFKIQFSENSADVFIELLPDDEWNKIMRSRHPLRWRLGLITKYKKCNVKLFSSSRSLMLEELVNFLIALGFKVELISEINT